MSIERLVSTMNQALPPGFEDFDAERLTVDVLQTVGDAPAEVEGRPTVEWLRDQLEAIRRSRRGKRGQVSRQGRAQARFEETLERLRAKQH